VPTNLHERRRHLIFRKLLDQTPQLIAFGAHDPMLGAVHKRCQDWCAHQLPKLTVRVRFPSPAPYAPPGDQNAHSYFVPPKHTARARRILGPDRLLIPEQAVYLGTDPAEARAAAVTTCGST
jgi:hypothetical protein